MKIIIFVALVIFPSLSFADWKIQKTVDSMTDKITKTAYVLSKDGNRFTLIRKSDQKVWGYLKLKGMNQFKINESLLLRVDKNKPRSISDKMQKKFGISSYEWNPSLMGFLVWHGKSDEGCGFIGQLLNGKKLIIRYHPNKSTYKDIIFNISKNKAAIKGSLGLENSQCK